MTAIEREICVYLDPQISEDLRIFSVQEHVSLKFLVSAMFRHGFLAWRAAKLEIPISDEDRKHYRRTSKK